MKILVLEESAMTRGFIQEELVPGDHTVVEAGTPEEAFEALATDPEIDLVTVRMYMQGMDCFEFLGRFHEPEMLERLEAVGNHDVPAVIVTSSDTLENRLHGFQVGAADFIQKPWPKGELLRTVNRVLGVSNELSGMTVLLAEDGFTARKFIRSCLERLGVRILECDDGQTAWEILTGNVQDVDLVLTDLVMKEMNGDELCLKIRRELGRHDLPVIFLSGNNDRERTLSLFKVGATDYIQKPFYQEELVARMRVHLEHRRLQMQWQEQMV